MRIWFKVTLVSLALITAAALSARSKVEVNFEHKGVQQHAKLYEYNKELYVTAYETFLGAGEVNDAYIVALAAVQQRSDDLKWRERLYQVSRWNGHDNMAMEQLLYLIDRTNNIKFIDAGIKLSEQLGDPEILRDLLRLKAKHASLSENERILLAKSQENMGDPEAAISYLKNEWKKKKNIVYLKEMANVYARMGALQLEVQVLKLLSKYEVQTTATIIREAQAYYAQNKLAKAFDILQSAKLTAKKNDKDYWELYADIAWNMQKTDEALHAYKLLFRSHKIDDAGLRRYITLIGRYDSYKAMQLTVKGWQRFKQPLYLVWFVQYSLRANDWSEFNNIYGAFDAKAKQLLDNLPGYRTAKIQLLLDQKDFDGAQVEYKKAISENPKDASLKLAYLWFLIDRRQENELRERLVQWQSFTFSSDDFTLAFAVGYRLLGMNYQAIALMFKGLPKHLSDVVYLVNYLDQLMEMRSSDGEPTDAERELRSYIWALIQFKAKDKKTWKDDTFAINYAKVASRLAPGQPTVTIMNYLSQFASQPEAADAVMAWALANQYYDAALRMYHQAQLAHVNVAPWIRLSLAMHDYNKDQMHELLTHHLSQLPVRDRVVAAYMTGEQTQAEELAYRALKEYPDNQKTYELFRQTMLPRSDYWSFEPEHVTTQLLMWQSYDTHGRYYVTPTLALMPYFDIRDQNGRNPEFITNVPSTNIESGLRVHKVLPRGYIDGSLGVRDEMRTFATSDWQWHYLLSDKWTMIWDLGIHQPADESDYMTVGAMQNEIGVLFLDRVTVRDEIALEATQHYFYGQDEEAVSNGEIYRASYTRRMWLQYPDYFVRLYGSVNKFHNIPDVTGSLDTLVPPGQQAAASGQLLLPASFVQYGLSVGVGERFREEYTHDWKPFAIASVFRNNNSPKLGTVFDGGIAGTVFGRDHLALFASHSAGVEGNANTRFVLGAAYRIYF